MRTSGFVTKSYVAVDGMIYSRPSFVVILFGWHVLSLIIILLFDEVT